MSKKATDTSIEFVDETAEQRRRREARQRRSRRRERAQWHLENNPEVSTMVEALKEADKDLEIEREVAKGNIDPSTGRPTRQAQRTQRRRARASRSTPPVARRSSGRPHRSSRPTRARSSAVRRTARTVAAPFGSAASAGWTIITGGLSLVVLYVVLRDAEAIGDFANGISTGFRRLADPYSPLIPSRGEASPPPPQRRRVVAGQQSQRRK